MSPSPRPICWNCGYDLSGVRADGICPECATPVWSRPGTDATITRRATHALGWGIASLLLFFMCIGPLAAFVAIPAIVIGGRVRREVREGLVPADQVSGAGIGFWMGWAVVGLSVGSLCIYALFAGLALGPALFPWFFGVP